MAQAEHAHVRLAELLAAVSMATDLGTGQPMEHALRTCHLAMRIARALDLPAQEQFDTYYLSLLRFLGCTSEASADAALNAGDEIAMYAGLAPALMGSSSEMFGWMVRHLAERGTALTRARALAAALTDPKGAERSIRAHCEVGQMLARRIGLGDSVLHALGRTFERWDGKGLPERIAGEEIPASCRVTIVARDLDLLSRLWGHDSAGKIMRERRGKAYEPRVIDAALEHGPQLMEQMEHGSIWDAVLADEPGPPVTIGNGRVDDILETFAHFVDLKSPFLHGHSSGVAALAERAAGAGSESDLDPKVLRRAGLVHDLGRVAVPSGIWDKERSLSDEEWERVRLHPYYSERILIRCGVLQDVAEVASSHHERMDGSGYHRRLRPPSLSAAARVLAAADAYHAMTEPRPHRPALSQEAIRGELDRACAEGLLDTPSVRAVLEAAGESRHPSRSVWPAGLTEREVEVLKLLATGLSNKQIARKLTVSPKTVGHHVEHAYTKLGVSTRAGATLFAVEHGLAGAAGR